MSTKTTSHRSSPVRRTVQTRRAQPNLQRAPIGAWPNPAEMQQRLGNSGTQAWLAEQGGGQPVQAKLTVGEPNDMYEQEADRVADTVMRMPEPAMPDDEETKVQAKPIANQITPLVRRKPEEGEEEEEEEIAQTKLESAYRPAIQRQMDEDGEEEELVQTKPLVNRQIFSKETQIQPKGAPSQTPQVTPAVAANVNALKSGGSPLPQSTRDFFEPRFGSNFSEVRVHTDSRAADTAKSINAKAFTVEENIAFGKGQYAPESQAGKRLLGHELTHVVQQGGGQFSQVATSLGNNIVLKKPIEADPLDAETLDAVDKPTNASDTAGPTEDDVYRAVGKFILELTPVVFARGPKDYRHTLLQKVTILWRHLGEPGETTVAERRSIMNVLGEYKEEVIETYFHAAESWAVLEEEYIEERVILEASNLRESQTALSLLIDEYQQAKSRTASAGRFLHYDDFAFLHHMLKEKTHMSRGWLQMAIARNRELIRGLRKYESAVYAGEEPDKFILARAKSRLNGLLNLADTFEDVNWKTRVMQLHGKLLRAYDSAEQAKYDPGLGSKIWSGAVGVGKGLGKVVVGIFVEAFKIGHDLRIGAEGIFDPEYGGQYESLVGKWISGQETPAETYHGAVEGMSEQILYADEQAQRGNYEPLAELVTETVAPIAIPTAIKGVRKVKGGKSTGGPPGSMGAMRHKPLPPKLVAAIEAMEERIIRLKERNAKLLERAKSSQEKGKSNLAERMEKLQERYEQLQDDLYDASSASRIKKRIGREVDKAETEMKALEKELGSSRVNTPSYDTLAEKLGYKKTNFTSHGQPVYRKGRRYISPDVGAHNVTGGWKMADSVKNLKNKETRMGTYDADLNRIGD